MSGDILSKYTGRVSALLIEKLRIKGRTLDRQVAKLGRRVPKRVRRDAGVLVAAQSQLGHPKLAQLIDMSEVERAGKRLVEHLEAIDPREVAKDRILWALAKGAFLVIVIFVALVWYAWDRGLV